MAKDVEGGSVAAFGEEVQEGTWFLEKEEVRIEQNEKRGRGEEGEVEDFQGKDQLGAPFRQGGILGEAGCDEPVGVGSGEDGCAGEQAQVEVAVVVVERAVVVDDQGVAQAGSQVEGIERIEGEPNVRVAGEESDFRSRA